ncbi:Uncharacterised protein g10166 [Pycnogonum litorale]
MNSETTVTPDTYDRAWNDPPVFMYDATKVNSSVPSRSKAALNKRVAFPQVSSPDKQSNDRSSLKMPPKSSCPPPLCNLDKLNTTVTNESSRSSLQDEAHVKESDLPTKENVLEKVQATLDKCYYVCIETLSNREADDVKKKLDIFYEMWKSDKLNDVVQRKMFHLCKELADRNFEAANDIHLGLMVDQVGQVRLWMVGIKRLIRQMKIIGNDIPSNETPTPISENSTDRKQPPDVKEDVEKKVDEIKPKCGEESLEQTLN